MCTIGGLGRHVGRQSTDTSVDYRSTIGRLSVDYRPTIDRLSTDYRPTIDQLSVDSRPIVGRQSTDKCVDRYSLKPSILDRYMTDT